MNKNKILQKDYTLSSLYYQIKLPLDLEILIPADDPVRLLSAFVEGMELSDLYKTYGKIKKNQASPRQLFKIIIYASMNRIYSSRDIETACHRDINFMYLLEGKPVPDHATIARFISLHFSKCSKNTLAEVSDILLEIGEISGKSVFIDGTKLESVANKYTFVWKRSVTKNCQKLFEKISDLIRECEVLYGIQIVYHDQISLHTLKRMRKKLYRIKKQEDISFVHGKGKRKTPLQRSIETLESYIQKLKEYIKKIHLSGFRLVCDGKENYIKDWVEGDIVGIYDFDEFTKAGGYIRLLNPELRDDVCIIEDSDFLDTDKTFADIFPNMEHLKLYYIDNLAYSIDEITEGDK